MAGAHGSRSTRSHLILTYELSIYLSNENGTWSDDFRFVDRPSMTEVNYLLEKAEETFQALFTGGIEIRSVTLGYLDKRDREELDTRYEVPHLSE